MIKLGSEAPDFKLLSHFGTECSLREFSGVKNVMIVFYPQDWTYT